MELLILGKGPSKANAPTDFEGEVWGLNDLHSNLAFTRWFELHPPGRWDAKFLREKDIPVYMQQHYPEVPKSIPYPLDKITRKYGRYFTNSISYMLALALDEGFKTILLYGADFLTNTEYYHQKGSVEYFLGVARAMGVDVFIHPRSNLLKAKLYGYEV